MNNAWERDRKVVAFWRWLRDLGQRRMHAAWMRRHFHDRQCPVCTTWYGETGSWRSRVSTGMASETITCALCDSRTQWLHDTMLPRAARIRLPARIEQMKEPQT